MKKFAGSRATVFAVWEPILATDTEPPGTSIMGRIGDTRVRQFWDPDHLIAAAIKTGLKTQPECCEQNGVLWDVAVAYAPGAAWRESMPEPSYIGGPVVKNQAHLEVALGKAPQ